MTQTTNRGACNTCGKIVSAVVEEHEGKMYLAKDCPKCGRTETLISSDSGRYMNKRALDTPHTYRHCAVDCLQCEHKKPNLVFVDITNRCNMNCPICINNTPSMGFLFEPPLDYFDTIFEHFSHYDPKPSIQLFGGEPTVHPRLFDIVELARKYKLPRRVVTNGIKLADPEYCRKLVKSRATILIAYDGDNPEMYNELRGDPRALELKKQALENIEKSGGRKVVVMSLVAKGFNEKELPELFNFCHTHRMSIRGIYLMPLAQTWNPETLDLKAERITTEDIEIIVDESFPEDRIEFIPAGFLGQLTSFRKYLKIKPLPFAGAHPNCESMYLLVSDGERYVPLARYLKTSTLDLCKTMLEYDARLASIAQKSKTSFVGRFLARLGLEDTRMYMKAFLMAVSALRRHFRISQMLKGRGVGKVWHGGMTLLKLMSGIRSYRIFPRHTNVHGVLQVIVLPFEDSDNLETERLERCPAAFAFVDPDDGEVKHVPVCAWSRFKVEVMRKITHHYHTGMKD